MENRVRQIVISVQLGMTVFFFIAAVIAFLFLRSEESPMMSNIWWILLIVAVADLVALMVLLKRFTPNDSAGSDQHRHG